MLRPIANTVNLLFMLCGICAHARPLQTNFISFADAPEWLSEGMLSQATGPIQDFLQWDLRRLKAFYYTDASAFSDAAGGNGSYKAFFRRKDGTIHLGPEIHAANFNRVFSHELVHAIFFQKYKGAIPAWLEEGFANYLGKVGSVEYAWLVQQPIPNVTTLGHPSTDPTGSHFHYQTSTALAEMIAAKCPLSDLFQLSVGRKIETYLSTFCEIQDLNAEYVKWIKSKAAALDSQPRAEQLPKNKSASASKRSK